MSAHTEGSAPIVISEETLKAVAAAPPTARALAEIGLRELIRSHYQHGYEVVPALALDIGIAAAEACRGCVMDARKRERFLDALLLLMRNQPLPVEL